MNIDLPLILTVIVGASGAIWLIDSLLFSPARSARLAELQKQYPRWNDYESADAKLFIESASREAADPVVVEPEALEARECPARTSARDSAHADIADLVEVEKEHPEVEPPGGRGCRQALLAAAAAAGGGGRRRQPLMAAAAAAAAATAGGRRRRHPPAAAAAAAAAANN